MSEILEFNLSTNEIILRQETQEEKSIRDSLKNEYDEMMLLVPAPNESNNEIKQSALSKLQALGLTLDEAKAIIGMV